MLGWVAAGASWHDAIITAIAVLIITCPCALGLAIPVVQVVASGALFRAGVLFNAGDAIERLADIDTVVFDKTGTLTLPEPEIVNFAEIPADMLVLAGRLSLSSSHPLATALARAAGVSTPMESAVEVPGEGVRAELNGVELRLGSPSFCATEMQAQALTVVEPGTSTITFRRGDECYIFAVRQKLRPDAAATIARLKRQSCSIEILSGDHGEAVERAARALGIETFRAAIKPAEKIAHIEVLKKKSRKVLMVGDGLNDAPALAAANASLSPVSALHLTQAAADAIFLGEHLAPVADALAIARRAKRLMRQNLWLAMLYNAIAVPIAIAGLATPLVAALAMSGSSLLVTVNALRAKSSRGIG